MTDKVVELWRARRWVHVIASMTRCSDRRVRVRMARVIQLAGRDGSQHSVSIVHAHLLMHRRAFQNSQISRVSH